MTNVIRQLPHAVAVIYGKNDYITPGKQNHRKFPVAVSINPSAHMNDIIVLRIQTVKFPRMILCFDLRCFHFSFFTSSHLVSVLFIFLLIVPCLTFHCFSSARVLHSFGRRCAQLSATWPTILTCYRDFPKPLRKMQKLHIKFGHKHFVLISLPMYLFSYYFKIRRYD